MTAMTFERNIRKGSFTTDRKDRWWLFPLVSGSIIVLFSLYTMFVLFFGDVFGEESYKAGHYLSPIFGVELPTSFLDQINWPKNTQGKYSLSPALLVIWAPIGFRATCYYMRKVYYRSFFGNPPGCGVDGIAFRRGKYTGERWLPLILNNFHRYFLYTAILIAIVHWYELLLSITYGVGLGTVILFLDTFFLTLYIGSCHAFRHLIGGGADCYSCNPIKSTQHKVWGFVSKINERHGTWFWLSLISVMVADIYIRLLSMGVITDIVFF